VFRGDREEGSEENIESVERRKAASKKTWINARLMGCGLSTLLKQKLIWTFNGTT
jgi:hypothetical protein